LSSARSPVCVRGPPELASMRTFYLSLSCQRKRLCFPPVRMSCVRDFFPFGHSFSAEFVVDPPPPSILPRPCPTFSLKSPIANCELKTPSLSPSLGPVQLGWRRNTDLVTRFLLVREMRPSSLNFLRMLAIFIRVFRTPPPKHSFSLLCPSFAFLQWQRSLQAAVESLAAPCGAGVFSNLSSYIRSLLASIGLSELFCPLHALSTTPPTHLKF